MSTEKKHNCPHCARSDDSQGESNSAGLLTGWQLGLASACVFLLPLIGALAGIAVFNRTEELQIVGGIAGLVVGLLLAMALARFFKKKN